MGASSITPNVSVQNLGVIFDQCINVYEHVTSVCRAAYYHLKNIHCLKAFLTQEALVTVVHAKTILSEFETRIFSVKQTS